MLGLKLAGRGRNTDVRRTKYSYRSGDRPFEDYTIKRGLGVGGFGEVYFAVSKAGKEVALKKIQRNLDIELRGVQQCLNLKHVNLISLWDIRSDRYGESWVVMEYVPGPSLRDVVEAYPQGMPEPQVKEWFTAIASGVAYLHEKGIVHRDLKPGNVFCDDLAGIVKIGDYGLSKFICSTRDSGQTEAVGTFHYMAPEIGNGIYGKEIDVYALGVVLFEMLTGTLPFDGESAQEIIMKHLTLPVDLSVVPEPFHTVLKNSLTKDPEQRYSCILEMLRDLPWPDVVDNAHKIVSWHTVGSMLETSDIPRGAAVSPTDVHPAGLFKNSPPPAETNYPDRAVAETKAVVLEASPNEVVVPDIQFGPLKHGEAPRRTSLLLDADMIGPVTRLLGGTFPGFADWWNRGGVSTSVRLLLLVLAGLVALAWPTWLVPAAVIVGAIYFAYYSLAGRGQNVVSKMLLEREARRVQAVLVRKWIAARPIEDRFTELVGSLLGSGICCVVLSFLGLVARGRFLNPSLDSWSQYLWMTIASIGCCWTAIVAGKLWEHQTEPGGLRRMTMLLSGFLIGGIVYVAARFLRTDLFQLAIVENESSFPTLSSLAVLPACLLMFCSLLGTLRWWRQADPLRRTRISIWSVGLCMMWAIIFSDLFHLPGQTICTVAFAAAVSIQFASPWLGPQKREEICQLPAGRSISLASGGGSHQAAGAVVGEVGIGP